MPDENYYKQPELYPTWTTTGINIYSGLKEDEPVHTSYPGVMGFGAYPGDQIIQVEKGGGIVEVISFWHAAWGVINWQGMNLMHVYPKTASVASYEIVQDPNKVSNYFDVVITPKIFLLDPSFPSFESNWAQKIKTKISIDPNIPTGKYLIGIITVDVPREQTDKWIRTYKLAYISPAGVGVATTRPTQQILIEVV